MLISKQALVWLFYNFSSSFQLLLLFSFFSSIFIAKLFHFLCSYPLLHRNHNGYEYMFSDEEDKEEDEEDEEEGYFHVDQDSKDHLVADIIHGGEGIQFLHVNNPCSTQCYAQEIINHHDSVLKQDEDEDEDGDDDYDTAELSPPHDDESQHGSTDMTEAEIPSDSLYNSEPKEHNPTQLVPKDVHKSNLVNRDETQYENRNGKVEKEGEKTDLESSGDEKYTNFKPPKIESIKKLVAEEKRDEDIFGDTCTAGSTSKSSSEWRSSINCGTDDPFSSSSRGSCPKWESYTVFQKYDEEMMFLDRISAQKLHETESLKSFEVCPRSISERIVYKFAAVKKKSSTHSMNNPYYELEAAYVAQICLTWEALNCNYINFQRKIASCKDSDPGCPAKVAQQFQQFQVLLQRYVENEPYEQGRRPEIYARMRLLAPKLLQVPEYRDSEDEETSDGSRISSPSFLMIMEDGIRTFMNFLKADKEKACEIIASFFKRNRRHSINPSFLHLMKKVNEKKKKKLKDIRRAGKCIRKRKVKVEEEMEILLSQIDLKVVSRVLRMEEISEEQLQWCEEKMSKVRIIHGKLQRDSTPLFIPSH